MKIGEKLRKKRDELGYSQESVAKQLVMTQPNYSKIESDLSEVKFEDLPRFADILKCSVWEFIPECIYNDSNTDNKGHSSNALILQQISNKHLEELLKGKDEIIKSKDEIIKSKDAQLALQEKYTNQFEHHINK